ncbi:MAG: transcriptional regulator, MarR family protein [Firmicutes bacterium]|nr:transcriptional regulator, MarR family protein [Bacillota bacterium]
MEHINDIKMLRESIRLLERKLGILDEINAPCCGVTFAQCHALVEVGRAGAIYLNKLADILGLDKSTMSRTINNLVNSGMVLRDIDPEDRRFITIKLTEQGNESFRQIEKNMDEYFSKVYNSVPEVKREQVLESLQILISALAENHCCE